MTWGPGRQVPDDNLIRFVSRRLRPNSRILDIGHGSGANAIELRWRRHIVTTLDKDRSTHPDIPADICDWDWDIEPQDCILDINTLCHVENPPLDKIYQKLVPGGFFFCIAPTDEAPERICEGKSYTLRRSESEMRDWLLGEFEPLDIRIWGPTNDPDFLGNYLKSWIAEARK